MNQNAPLAFTADAALAKARERLAAVLFGAGVFMPLGLANLPPAWPDSYMAFILLLLAATALVPDTFRQVWRAVPAWRSVTAVMLVMIAWVVLPIGLSDGPWRLVDYPSRLLVVPWCAALAITPARCSRPS